MQEQLQKKVLDAFQLVLRPVVKILLRYGIGYSQFAETVKTAFVDVGTTDFGIRGRPTNISRIAVMTGLTRKEVRRIRTKLENGKDELTVKSTPITEILHRWHVEQEFLDASGRPATLPFAGEKGSFASLVKQFAGDVPTGAMRTELLRVGSISEGENGELSVLRRSFWPSDKDGKLRSALVHHVYPLLSTVAHNTSPDTNTDVDIHAQFATYSLNIDEADRPRVKRVCADRLSGIAESFDDLFSAYQVRSETSTADSKSPVVVGVYYFEERDKNTRYEW